MSDEPIEFRWRMSDSAVALAAAARMRAWAEENPQADTQGLMDDEWAALASAAVEDSFTAAQHFEAVRVLRRQLNAVLWMYRKTTGFDPGVKEYMEAFTALEARAADGDNA